MSDPVYKIINVVGSSAESYEAAIRNAVEQATKTLEDLKWFEVTEFRGGFFDKKVVFQATVKIGFKLKD